MQTQFKPGVAYRLKTLVAACLIATSASALAAELSDGTVISKANLDQIKNDTFMGHTIGSLLTEKVEWQIRNTGLKMKLGKSKEPEFDPKYVESTKKYSDQVKFDPKTREVTGWVAGLPFPDISESDPDAGEKVMWNFYYGSPYPRDIKKDVYFVTVNSSGYEATQHYIFDRLINKGRLGEGKTVLGDPDVLTKTMLVAVEPQDIKGTGTFTVRYDVSASKLEDQFAYIKSARRIRRLTGNAWMDPVGGLDFLNDDIYAYNARPSQYKQNKLIGKRWILAAVDYKVTRNAAKAGTLEEWPIIDSSGPAPYWYQKMNYAPREVWVVEGTPPPEHPYSKKIVYVDTKIPAVYMAETYDKKGDFWRYIEYGYDQLTGQTTGINYMTPAGGEFIDFKAKHETQFIAPGVVDYGAKWGQYTPEALEALQ
jgi:Protein of unknown function (DUF1329)